MVITSGGSLVSIAVQFGRYSVEAHDGAILCVDWNTTISGLFRVEKTVFSAFEVVLGANYSKVQ